MNATQGQKAEIKWYYDPQKRAWVFQLLVLVIVASIVSILVYNTQENLAKQNIASGFGFLSQEAGFEISETIIDYWADDTYRKAIWVGILNTFKVAIIGNILAVFLGIMVGIFRLSPNWLVSRISLWYIELTRNVPLLLQLFFWYALFTEILPPVKQAWNPLPHVFLTQRGFYFPIFESAPGWTAFFWTFFAGLIGCLGVNFWSEKYRQRTGKKPKTTYLYLGLLLIFPLIAWAIGGAPLILDRPQLGGFNFNGGYSLTPEFAALMCGLVLYTGAFNAEIVRAGIESVSKGQWEAGESLGLSRFQVLRLIVLPQSLRVIIPPLTSQVLNLIKNSSLAVGIGYPDFVAVANTTMNQTGQAIEAVLLIMGVYLVFSLTTSILMNTYNRFQQLKGRS